MSNQLSRGADAAGAQTTLGTVRRGEDTKMEPYTYV